LPIVIVEELLPTGVSASEKKKKVFVERKKGSWGPNRCLLTPESPNQKRGRSKARLGEGFLNKEKKIEV